MKFVFLLGCFVLIIGSCKKDAGIQPAPIAGTWVWQKTYLNGPLGPNNPSTPQNTGNIETLIFLGNGNWKQVLNGSTIDSGTYSLGHGSYTPYIGSGVFVYDSIGFYKEGLFLGWDAYEIKTDALIFNTALSGRFSTYMLPNGGSKWWKKN